MQRITFNHAAFMHCCAVQGLGYLAVLVSLWTTHVQSCREAGIYPFLQASKSLLVTVLASAWALRLAGFLALRALKFGHDTRMDDFFPQSADERWLTGPSL